MQMTDVNLIKYIKDVTLENIDAPKIFHEMLAYHGISATLGMFFRPRTILLTRPNVFFVMSCIPGRGRRSTMMNMSGVLVNSALTQYYEKTLNCSISDAQDKVWKSRIERGTPQGICDKIIEGLTVKTNSFILCNGEFGETLRRMSIEKDPTAGTGSLLCNLYYGESYTEDLSQRGGKPSRLIPEGLYVTMFSSMQEPKYYLTKKSSRIGLLRRLGIGYVKEFSMDGWKPPIRSAIIDYKDRLKDISKNFIAPRMMKYHRLLETLHSDLRYSDWFLEVQFGENTRKKLEEIARKVDEELSTESGQSDYSIYQQTRWEYVAKISILNAIAKDQWVGEEKKGAELGGFIFVKDENMNEAIKFNEAMDKHTKDMMDEIGREEREHVQESLIQRIENLIRKAGPNGLQRAKLATSLPGLTAEQIREQINTLLKQEKIRIVDILPESGMKGKETRYYIHTIYPK